MTWTTRQAAEAIVTVCESSIGEGYLDSIKCIANAETFHLAVKILKQRRRASRAIGYAKAYAASKALAEQEDIRRRYQRDLKKFRDYPKL